MANYIIWIKINYYKKINYFQLNCGIGLYILVLLPKLMYWYDTCMLQIVGSVAILIEAFHLSLGSVMLPPSEC